MDINTLSIADLKSLYQNIPAEIKRREKEDKIRIRREMENIAKQAGYSLDELLDDATDKTPKAKKQVAIKYRHPQDNTLCWTGRGRQPKWVVEFLAAGGSLEQLTI